MNKEFRFKIEESEMMEYYQYVFAMLPKNKTRVVWIRGSIPVLLAFTIWYFRVYHLIWLDVIAVIVSLVWMIYLSSKLWSRFILGQVKNWFKQNIKTAKFPQVHVSFGECIKVDGKEIPYSSLRQVMPLKHVLIFGYGENEVFLIPNRVIGDNDAMEEFSAMLAEKKNAK